LEGGEFIKDLIGKMSKLILPELEDEISEMEWLTRRSVGFGSLSNIPSGSTVRELELKSKRVRLDNPSKIPGGNSVR